MGLVKTNRSQLYVNIYGKNDTWMQHYEVCFKNGLGAFARFCVPKEQLNELIKLSIGE